MIYEKKYLMLILLLAAILLVTPQAIRMLNHNNSIVNSEAYYNLRVYNQESTNYDFLQGHNVPLNLLNMLKVSTDIQKILFSILPIILGLSSIILLYLILHKHNIPEKTILAIILLTTVSPIFIYTFTDFKISAFIIFLNVLGLYLLMHDKHMMSSIPFVIIPFIDLFSSLITLAFLLTYMFSSHRHRTGCKIASIALLAAIIFSFVLNIYYDYAPKLFLNFSIQNVLTDIGANIGVSFSIIILTVIGLILLWENGLRNVVLYSILAVFLTASMFNSTIRIYMNFIIMIYAGFAFIYLNRRKWSINIIKKTTILLIVCSIFFSSLVYMTKIIQSEPTPDYIDALQFLKSQSLPSEVILSSPENGYFIEYYAERMVFVDEMTKYYDADKYNTLDIVANSRSLERTEEILQKYNIKYVVIDSAFEPYLIEKEGLLFLIENSQKFTNIYQSERIKIWLYVGQE